ncbi:hypothetical protein EBZ35_07360 [bacterium]|nr:hypothetical protein [bacterium]
MTRVRGDYRSIWDPLLTRFRSIALPELGFMPFEWDDVCCAHPTDWGMTLNKRRGAGILYGVQHCWIRRAFFNDLPLSARCEWVTLYWNQYGIGDRLSQFLGQSVSLGDSQDVQDIGMGHMVLAIHFSSGQSVVIKPEPFPHQPYYQQLLQVLGCRSIRSHHFSGDFPIEISEWVPGTTVCDTIFSRLDPDPWLVSDTMIRQLAFHAALGDVIGREDRHLENYIWDAQSQAVVPVDTSVLFGDGNESWVFEYVAGGLAEWAVLAPCVQSPTLFEQGKAMFRSMYQAAHHQIAQQMGPIQALTAHYFGTSAGWRSRFMQDRVGVPAYLTAQLARYEHALSDWQRRWQARIALSHAVTNGLSLATFPLLHMYHLAHEGRGAAFFLHAMHQPFLAREWQQAGLGDTQWMRGNPSPLTEMM